MELLKKYFSTPKMPLSFYYTPYVIVYLVWFLFLLMMGQMDLYRAISLLFVFLLGSYTYAWLSDYMIFTKNNVLINVFFMKSMVFRRDFGTLVATNYNIHRSFGKYKIKGNMIREAHEEYVKSTAIAIFGVAILKYVLAVLFIWVFWLSIFTHPFVMKKYREKIEALYDVDDIEEDIVDEIN